MNTADDVRAHARAMVAEIETYRDPTGCELRAAKLIDRLEARIAQLERALARKGLVADANARDAQLAEQRVRELEEAHESRAATWKARAEAAEARVRELETKLDEATARADRLVQEAIDAGDAEDAAERRVRELKEALRDACDVAIWLSGLPCLRRDAWSHWESDARPKLYRAMGVLQREEKT